MTTNLLPRRGLALLAVAVLALGLVGCGDYYDDDYYGGTLEVRNDPTSFESIEYVNVWVDGGPIESFAMFLLPGENDFIDFYPDTYTVQLEWSDALVETFPFVDIYDDSITLIVGIN